MINEKNNEQEIQITLNKDDFRYLPLREAVYVVIKKAILENQMPPGQRFTEEKLADKLGVSRTPLREALRKLENEGYITVHIGRYAEVTSIKHEELLEEYALREVIEGFASKLAAKHCTRDDLNTIKFHLDRMQDALNRGDVQTIISSNSDFHLAIIEAAKNRKLIEIMDTLWKSMRMLSNSSLKNLNWAKESIDQHREIFMAIEAQDSELAEILTQAHIKSAMQALPEERI